VEKMVLIDKDEGEGESGVYMNVNNIEELISNKGELKKMMEIKKDDDDENMVEIDIDIRMKENEGGEELKVIKKGLKKGMKGIESIKGIKNISGKELKSLKVLE
jgi:hypothetical protein